MQFAPVMTAVTSIPFTRLVAVSAELLTNKISCSGPAFLRGLQSNLESPLAILSAKVLHFNNSPRARDCCNQLAEYMTKVQKDISIFGFAISPKGKALNNSADSEVLLELAQSELLSGSFKQLYQNPGEVSAPLEDYINSLVQSLEPEIHSIAKSNPLAAIIIAEQGIRLLSNDLWSRVLGPDYEGIHSAFKVVDTDLKFGCLASLVSKICLTDESLVLLKEQIRSVPNKYKLDSLSSSLSANGEAIFPTLNLCLEILSRLPRAIENLNLARGAAVWGVAVETFSAKRAVQSSNRVGSELEFGSCDTGVIMVGPRSRGDALSVTFLKALNLAVVATSSGSDNPNNFNVELTTSNDQPVTISAHNFMYIDSAGNVFTEPQLRYSKAAHVVGKSASQFSDCVSSAGAILDQVWNDFPRLFTHSKALGPLYIIVEDPRRYIIAPTASSDFLSSELKRGPIPSSQTERFARVSGLKNSGGWVGFELLDTVERPPLVDGADAPARSAEKRLFHYFKNEAGFITYPQLVSALRRDFQVSEDRSEGKGSHGALFRATEEGRTRFTTCTSIRGISEPMKFTSSWTYLRN